MCLPQHVGFRDRECLGESCECDFHLHVSFRLVSNIRQWLSFMYVRLLFLFPFTFGSGVKIYNLYTRVMFVSKGN
jgi:hypothetical protein